MKCTEISLTNHANLKKKNKQVDWENVQMKGENAGCNFQTDSRNTQDFSLAIFSNLKNLDGKDLLSLRAIQVTCIRQVNMFT